jgi:hypothetical protein
MRGPPDPEMRNRPAGHGTADRRADLNKHEENTETVREFQARSLRQRFALDYYFAVTVAPLIWGLPR